MRSRSAQVRSDATLPARAGLAPDRVAPYTTVMSHTIRHKSKLVGRVRRIKGQIEAVERALEAELGCTDVLMLVASVRGGGGGRAAGRRGGRGRRRGGGPARGRGPGGAE